MQKTVNGKNYYTFEYGLKSPNFTSTSFATVAVANGELLLYPETCTFHQLLSNCKSEEQSLGNFSTSIPSGRYYTLIVAANERRWKRVRNKLKVVADSFQVLDIWICACSGDVQQQGNQNSWQLCIELAPVIELSNSLPSFIWECPSSQ